MPRQSKSKPNRRQQKATRRSTRLAEKHLGSLSDSRCDDTQSPAMDGTTCNIGSDMEIEDEQPPHKILYPSSRLERLPPELVLLIGERLPVASRIALALTSHVMMFKSGGIGPGTNNIATDGSPGHGFEDNSATTSPHPSALMELLELLERDSLLLTRCDYCRVLHAPFSDPFGYGCGKCSHYVSLFRSQANITLPLVRRAMLWHRRGLDSNSLLAMVRKNSYVQPLYGTGYTSLVDARARAVGSSVILRQQLFIARDCPFVGRGRPSARDIAALRYAPGILLTPTWSWDVGYHLEDLDAMTIHQCQDSRLGNVPHGYKCYRDNKGPSHRALRPALRCLLTHDLPCTACPKDEGFFGRVDGNKRFFEDYSQNAIPVPNTDNPWGRVLVFTCWRDLGDGSSVDEAKWQMQPRPGFGYDTSFADYRQTQGSRPGDAYEAFEGARQGTPYVPVLPKSVARQLFNKRPVY